MTDTNNTSSTDGKALKAGVWYTICTVLQKGLSFITMPVFTRIMSKADMGLFSTYASWISLFVTITTFDLPLSIIRSKHEFKDDIESYSFSILTLTTAINTIFLAVTLLFKDWIFGDLLEIKPAFLLPMFLYLFLSPATDVYATKNRAFYKYKAYLIATLAATITSTAVSVFLVVSSEDKLSGRFYGNYITLALVGLVFYVIVAVQGKRVKFKYWKDGFVLCFPLLLHLLSLYILGSSDKIMITKFVGAEFTALYGTANSAVHVATVLMHSLNRSWAPWMLDMLEYKNYKKLNDVVKPYILLYFTIVLGCLLAGPEIILILGGRAYQEAVYIMPPLFIGTMFTFMYQIYLQTELYEKKTKYVGLATVIAALINIGLNFVFIPKFGYIAAGYTTLIGYMCMFLFHYFYSCKLGYRNLFDNRFIFGILGFALLLLPIMSISYKVLALRIVLILAYCAVMAFAAYKYRDKIKEFIASKKRSRA